MAAVIILLLHARLSQCWFSCFITDSINSARRNVNFRRLLMSSRLRWVRLPLDFHLTIKCCHRRNRFSSSRDAPAHWNVLNCTAERGPKMRCQQVSVCLIELFSSGTGRLDIFIGFDRPSISRRLMEEKGIPSVTLDDVSIAMGPKSRMEAAVVVMASINFQ